MTEKTLLLGAASARVLAGLPTSSFNPMLRGPQVAHDADDEAGGGSGSLSIEEAVQRLNSADEPEAPEGDAGGAVETQDPEGAASAPEEAEDGAETPAAEDDETEAEPGAVAPAEPPKYWSKEAKAKFAALDPEMQAVVLAQEGPREEYAAKARAEAAQERAARIQRDQETTALAEGLNSFLPKAVEVFKDRWGDTPPDWDAIADQYGTEAMVRQKVRYDADRELLAQTARATQEADAKARQVYIQAEAAKLAEMAPELVDPKDGAARRKDVVQYLLDANIPKAAIDDISAVELSMAHKAMLWDRAQAKAKAATPSPTPRPGAGAKAPLTRGGATQGPADPKAKQIHGAKSRFGKSRSVADAVALLNSLGD